MNDKPNGSGVKRRPIRSFVLRQGRMTAGQARAMESHWGIFGLEVEQGPQDFTQLFGREAPTILEIGFGNGKSLLEMAQVAPEKNYIGVEVHRPGVGALINDIERLEVQNIRVYWHDAIEVLKRCIPDNSLQGVQLFFPDPWHKTRHHKRRIVQLEFAELLRQKLKVGGYFHMATDWQNYAAHTLKIMSNAPGYVNQAGEGQYSPKPDYRPETKFESRGLRLGHGVWDLVFVKQ